MNIIELIRYMLKKTIETIEFLCGVGVIVWGKRHKAVSENPTPKKTLIIQIDSIGDVLMTTPAVKKFHQVYPGSKLDVITLPHTKVLLEGNINVNRIYSCDKKFWRKIFYKLGDFKMSAAAIKKIRNEKYDLCIDFVGTFESSLLALLSGSAKVQGPLREMRYGIFTANTRNFYDSPIRVDQKHISKKCLQISGLLGEEDIKEEVFIPQSQNKAAEHFLQKNGLSGTNFIIIHPGAKWPPKRWPESSFAQIINKLYSEKGIRAVVVGHSQEKEMLEKIKKESGECESVFACDLGLIKLAAVIKKAKVFIGNDSGPAHIAAAVGTRAILLFGPTAPERGAPLADSNVIFYKKALCSPCIVYYRRNECQKGTNECLKTIEPDKVFAEVMRILDEDK